MTETATNKWRSGLARTRKTTFGRIANFFGATEIDANTWDELEALFIQSDMGLEVTEEVIDALKERHHQEGLTKVEELGAAMKEELLARLEDPPPLELSEKPSVILVVGVNGSGKTTNMAKLGQRFQNDGKNVLFGAADTFRAAAIEQ